MNDNTQAYALDWDDEVSFAESTSRNYVTLEPGEYPIKAVKFERTQWKGSAKIPSGTPCAKIYYEVETEDGVAAFTDDLPLYSTLMWKVTNMFCCLGLRSHGDDKAKMPWSEIVGSTGRAMIKKRKWTGNDGTDRWSNEIDRYLDPKLATVAAASAAPKKWSL